MEVQLSARSGVHPNEVVFPTPLSRSHAELGFGRASAPSSMLRHAARNTRQTLLCANTGVTRRSISTDGAVVESDIVIVGGGPAGLALASALGESATIPHTRSTYIKQRIQSLCRIIFRLRS